MAKSNPVSRWCFTLNNFTDLDIEKLALFITEENCKHGIVAKEIAQSTGTPHLQGFINKALLT